MRAGALADTVRMAHTRAMRAHARTSSVSKTMVLLLMKDLSMRKQSRTWRRGRANEQRKTWRGGARGWARRRWCGSTCGCGSTSGSSSSMRRSSSTGCRGARDSPLRDGTKHHSSSRHARVQQRGTAVVIVGWHCTHAIQRRHGRDSGGAVASAWGERAIVCIGPGWDVGSGCFRWSPIFFNFSKILFCLPNPGLRAVPQRGIGAHGGRGRRRV